MNKSILYYGYILKVEIPSRTPIHSITVEMGSLGLLVVSAESLEKNPNNNIEITNRHFKNNPVKSSPENKFDLEQFYLIQKGGNMGTYKIATEYHVAVPLSSPIRWW